MRQACTPVNPASIPESLKAWPHWVCWSWEERDGEQTKVPKNPRTGGNAKSNTPDTWGSFEETLQHYQGRIDITTVKEPPGHKTLTMTLRYSHLAPSHKVKAVDILDSTLNENSTSYLLHSLEVVKS